MTLLALCDGWRKMLPRDDNGLLITGYVGQSSDDYNDEWLHCILVDFEKEQFFCHNLVRFVKFLRKPRYPSHPCLALALPLPLPLPSPCLALALPQCLMHLAPGPRLTNVLYCLRRDAVPREAASLQGTSGPTP